MESVSLATQTRQATSTIYLVSERSDRVRDGRGLAAPLVGETERDHRLARRGAHPDVVELTPPDGKERVGIEQVRAAIRAAQFAPVQGQRKVCLIPTAEALTPEAANALLKTLEEPPREMAFVLLATHTNDLLPTIVSRSRIVRLPATSREADRERLVDRGYSDAEARWLLAVADRDTEIDRFFEERLDIDALRAAAEERARQLDPPDLVAAVVSGESIVRRAAVVELLERAERRDVPLLTEGIRTFASQTRPALFAFLADLLAACSEGVRAGADRMTASDPRTLRAACVAIDRAHRALSVHGPTEAILLSLLLSIGEGIDAH